MQILDMSIAKAVPRASAGTQPPANGTALGFADVLAHATPSRINPSGTLPKAPMTTEVPDPVSPDLDNKQGGNALQSAKQPIHGQPDLEFLNGNLSGATTSGATQAEKAPTGAAKSDSTSNTALIEAFMDAPLDPLAIEAATAVAEDSKGTTEIRAKARAVGQLNANFVSPVDSPLGSSERSSKDPAQVDFNLVNQLAALVLPNAPIFPPMPLTAPTASSTPVSATQTSSSVELVQPVSPDEPSLTGAKQPLDTQGPSALSAKALPTPLDARSPLTPLSFSEPVSPLSGNPGLQKTDVLPVRAAGTARPTLDSKSPALSYFTPTIATDVAPPAVINSAAGEAIDNSLLVLPRGEQPADINTGGQNRESLAPKTPPRVSSSSGLDGKDVRIRFSIAPPPMLFNEAQPFEFVSSSRVTAPLTPTIAELPPSVPPVTLSPRADPDGANANGVSHFHSEPPPSVSALAAPMTAADPKPPSPTDAAVPLSPEVPLLDGAELPRVHANAIEASPALRSERTALSPLPTPPPGSPAQPTFLVSSLPQTAQSTPAASHGLETDGHRDGKGEAPPKPFPGSAVNPQTADKPVDNAAISPGSRPAVHSSTSNSGSLNEQAISLSPQLNATVATGTGTATQDPPSTSVPATKGTSPPVDDAKPAPQETKKDPVPSLDPKMPAAAAAQNTTSSLAQMASVANATPSPTSSAPEPPAKSSSPSPLPPAHQMLDAAPVAAATDATGMPPSVHTTPDSGALQMRIGVHTNAFGAIEVRTVIDQSQVGISIHADHNLARWFHNEVGGLEVGLKSQHLSLTAVDFSCDRSGVHTATSFQHGQPRQNFSQSSGPAAAVSPAGDPGTAEPEIGEPEIDAHPPAILNPAETRVSILA